MKLKTTAKTDRGLKEQVWQEDFSKLLEKFGSSAVDSSAVFAFENSPTDWLQVEFRDQKPRRLVFTRDGGLSYWADLSGVSRDQVIPALRLFAEKKDEEVKSIFQFAERQLAPKMSGKDIDAHFDALQRPWWKFWG